MPEECCTLLTIRWVHGLVRRLVLFPWKRTCTAQLADPPLSRYLWLA